MRFSRRPAWLQTWRHLVLPAGLSLCCGLATGLWFWQEDIEALTRVRDQVLVLQEQRKPPEPSVIPGRPVKAVTADVTEPDSRQASAVWSWLERRLSAHGLQIQSLRLGAQESVANLPEQTVVLEVLGRWSDWQSFEHQMLRHAPWWTVQQWHVMPTGQAGQVKMQWHLRWAWRAWTPEQRGATDLPDWGAPSSATTALFDEPLSAVHATRQDLSDQALPPDPGHWPVQALRLQGIWQQGGVSHAVLGDGLFQVVLAPGQKVGREGYRVHHVGEGQVLLQPADTKGDKVVLQLTGGEK